MKKSKIFVLLIALMVLFVFTMPAFSADLAIEKKIETVKIKTDKNGNPYTMLLLQEQKELKGVKYNTVIAAMAFGSIHNEASKLKAGDTFKGIVTEREYQGRMNYTILKVIP